MKILMTLSDSALHFQTQAAASNEKQATLVLLEHLLEIDRRGLAFTQGFGSIWDYVHRGLKYSEAAASERVAAMRLLKRAPDAAGLMKSQELSLTVAAKIQHYVKAIEKSENRKMKSHETMTLVQEVAGKSKREVERLFINKAPGIVSNLMPKERVRELGQNLVEIKLIADHELLRLMEESKTLFGCSNQAHTLKRALKIAIEIRKKELGLTEIKSMGKKSKNEQSKSAPKPQPSLLPPSLLPRTSPKTQLAVAHALRVKHRNSRYIPTAIRKTVWKKAESRCEYKGQLGRCVSDHELQIDHIKALALGGITEPTNLRLLCKNHNLAEARAAGLLYS